MLKLFPISILCLFFTACVTEPAEEVFVSPDVEDSMEEPLDIPEVPEEPVEFVFNTIEDYAKLKTKQEIIDAFGSENVKSGTSWYAEGTVQLKHSLVTNPKNKHIVKYLWNVENPKKLNSIEISYFDWDKNYEVKGTQKVLSDCGVYTGMPINELRKWNGADFNFSGFGWDYEGGVFANDKSRLSTCPVAIKLGLRHDGDLDAAEGLYGDQELNTSNPLVKKGPIIIDRITYYFE
jgi:hypothetical protein